MTEHWAPVEGYESVYEVSDLGRLRSVRNGTSIISQRVNPKSGYLTADLFMGARETVVVHRLVAAAFLGARPKGWHTRHLDGDKMNNAVSNLAYGTLGQNMDDSVRHGTHNQARKTECPAGHAYDAANTRVAAKPNGRTERRCRACERARKAAYRRLKSAS